MPFACTLAAVGQAAPVVASPLASTIRLLLRLIWLTMLILLAMSLLLATALRLIVLSLHGTLRSKRKCKWHWARRGRWKCHSVDCLSLHRSHPTSIIECRLSRLLLLLLLLLLLRLRLLLNGSLHGHWCCCCLTQGCEKSRQVGCRRRWCCQYRCRHKGFLRRRWHRERRWIRPSTRVGELRNNSLETTEIRNSNRL